MEVNSTLYNQILNECCTGLGYDTCLGQYSFMFRNVSPSLLTTLTSRAKEMGVMLHKEDLNHFLLNISKGHTLCTAKKCQWTLYEGEVLTGEVLRVYGSNTEYIDVVKVYAGEYLVAYSGYPFCESFLKISGDQCFSPHTELYTDDGRPLFMIDEVEILQPTFYHRALDRYYLPQLSKAVVADNLWPCYNMLFSLLQNAMSAKQQQAIYDESSRNGISLFTLLYFLKAIERMKTAKNINA